jgi:hypothetical protein
MSDLQWEYATVATWVANDGDLAFRITVTRMGDFRVMLIRCGEVAAAAYRLTFEQAKAWCNGQRAGGDS